MSNQNPYAACTLCPRRCGIDRTTNTATQSTNAYKGFCKESADLRIAWAGLHFGEEPVISVQGGSGTIFVTGCNLRCAFCQNYQISQKSMGKIVSKDDFVKICMRLKNAGAENINIVTGSHAIPVLAEYLSCAKSAGLDLPVCWNCSAYETIEALELLLPVVDIWLPDLKTLNPLISEDVFKAKDYPSVAKKAIRFMHTHTKACVKNDKMYSGVIVRHLALPGRLDDTRLVLDWFAKHLDGAYLSLMSQYTPVPFEEEEKLSRQKALSAFANRYICEDEFNTISAMLEEYQIENGFYQELVQDTEWLPRFEKMQPFSSALAKPIWHWTCGFVE